MSVRKGSGTSLGQGARSEWASALAALSDPVFIFQAVRYPDGTVADLQFVFLNEAAGRLIGQPIESVLGRGQIEVYPSVREVGIWDTYMRVLESGTAEVFDVPWFHDNGLEGSFRLAPSRFGDGILVSAHDTTDQVKAEKALVAESAILRATVDSLLDPHVRFGLVRDEVGQIIDFVFEDANAAACEYNKMTYEELIGTRLLDLLPGHTATGLLELYRGVVETGEPLVLDDYVYPHELLGGEERRYDIRAARIAGNGLSYTWRDVTDRYLRVEELEQFQRLTLGRELKMIELKKEIEYLKEYGSTGNSDPDEGFET